MTSTASDRMTGAQLQIVIDWLGLDQRSLAAILGVDERTVRRWVGEASRIPEGVQDEVLRMKDATSAAVQEVVASFNDSPAPHQYVYRSTEALWADRPDLRPYPAGWWRMVIARAVDNVPDAAITYAPSAE